MYSVIGLTYLWTSAALYKHTGTGNLFIPIFPEFFWKLTFKSRENCNDMSFSLEPYSSSTLLDFFSSICCINNQTAQNITVENWKHSILERKCRMCGDKFLIASDCCIFFKIETSTKGSYSYKEKDCLETLNFHWCTW